MTENQALPHVKIELNGHEFTLHYSIYSFMKLQEVASINALTNGVDFSNPKHLLYFLWAGLISHHEEFDGDLLDGRPDAKLSQALRDVGTMLSLKDLSRIGDSLKEAFQRATVSKAETSNKRGRPSQKKVSTDQTSGTG